MNKYEAYTVLIKSVRTLDQYEQLFLEIESDSNLSSIDKTNLLNDLRSKK